MRLLLLFIVIIGSFSTLQAQQEWVDYAVGRPDIFYLDAKRAVAKNWGINYRAESAGCIDCEDTRLRAAELNQSNQVYFKTIERRYGPNWLADFNRAVAKKRSFLLAQSGQEDGIWVDYMVEEQGDSEYYKAKAEVAKEWGINYRSTYFDRAAMDPKEEEDFDNILQNGDPYLSTLQNRLGDNIWDWLEEETQLRLLQKTAPQLGTWTDVVWGSPNSLYYEAKAAVAQRWGIAYKAQFMGNERSATLVNQQKDLLRQNAVYFSKLNQHFRMPWMVKFHREVQQTYAQLLK